MCIAMFKAVICNLGRMTRATQVLLSLTIANDARRFTPRCLTTLARRLHSQGYRLNGRLIKYYIKKLTSSGRLITNYGPTYH